MTAEWSQRVAANAARLLKAVMTAERLQRVRDDCRAITEGCCRYC